MKRRWFALCLTACLLIACGQTEKTESAATETSEEIGGQTEGADGTEEEISDEAAGDTESFADTEEAAGTQETAQVQDDDAAPDPAWASRAVMVNGELYYGTGLINANKGRCGTLDGDITSACDASELPGADGQANFEGAEGFQSGLEDGTIEIELPEEPDESDGGGRSSEQTGEQTKHWYVFATESVRDELLQNALPPYRYNGDNDQEAVLTEYFLTEENYYYQSYGSVTIPAFCILLSEETEDGRCKVYGNFWMFSYTRDGQTLACESGGVTPGAVYLREEDGGYVVDEFERIGDGSDYETDLSRICGGNTSLEEQYRGSAGGDSETVKAARLSYINEYVQENGLDITSYQDYGQDPVPLSEADSRTAAVLE